MRNSRIWHWYAKVYDELGGLLPYQQMLQDVTATTLDDRPGVWLDVGCGTGNLMNVVKDAKVHVSSHPTDASFVWGIDGCESMLRRAQRKRLSGELVLANLEAYWPFADGYFTVVSCINVLYALSDPLKALQEVHRVVKPDGRLIVVNPKSSVSPLQIFLAHLGGEHTWRHGIRIVRHLPGLIGVGLCNAWLLAGYRRGKHYFPAIDELSHLVTSAGFGNLQCRDTYAGQAWLVTGVRT